MVMGSMVGPVATEKNGPLTGTCWNTRRLTKWTSGERCDLVSHQRKQWHHAVGLAAGSDRKEKLCSGGVRWSAPSSQESCRESCSAKSRIELHLCARRHLERSRSRLFEMSGGTTVACMTGEERWTGHVIIILFMFIGRTTARTLLS